MALALSLTGLEARVIQLEVAQNALPTRQNVSERLGTFSDDLLVLDDTDLTQSDSIDRLREALRALNVSVFNHIPLFVGHTGDNEFGHHEVFAEDPEFVSFVTWDTHTGNASAHHPQVAQTGLVTTQLFESHSGKSYEDAHVTESYWGGWTNQTWSVGQSRAGVGCRILVVRSSSGDIGGPRSTTRGITIKYPGVYVCDANIGFEITSAILTSGQGIVSISLNTNDNIVTGCFGTSAMTLRTPLAGAHANCTASARQIIRLNSGDIIIPTHAKRYNQVGMRVAANGSNFSVWRIGN